MAPGLPHGRPYRPFAQRQVRRAGTVERGEHLVGQGQSADAAGHYDALRATCWPPRSAGTLRPGPVCAPTRLPLSVRFVQEYAWHNLFVRNLFIVPPPGAGWLPASVHVLTAPSFKADPAGTHTIRRRHRAQPGGARVIIAGTSYAGENKKAIFTVLNYVLPCRRPRHALLGEHRRRRDTALFFGLSGTGKTTLSSDPERRLIGDDEHVGAIAACSTSRALLREDDQTVGRAEPRIFSTTRRSAPCSRTCDRSRHARLELDDASLTRTPRRLQHRVHRQCGARSWGHPRTSSC